VLKPILDARRATSARDAKPSPPFPAVQCPTAQLAVRIVANSNAFTFASLGMVRNELERGEIVPLFPAPWLRVDWGLVRSRKRSMSPAMNALAEELQRTYSDVLRQEALLGERWSRSPEAVWPSKRAERRKPAAAIQSRARNRSRSARTPSG
jgi:hypothetical protein